jgi:hypothetical protein
VRREQKGLTQQVEKLQTSLSAIQAQHEQQLAELRAAHLQQLQDVKAELEARQQHWVSPCQTQEAKLAIGSHRLYATALVEMVRNLEVQDQCS